MLFFNHWKLTTRNRIINRPGYRGEQKLFQNAELHRHLRRENLLLGFIVLLLLVSGVSGAIFMQSG